MKEPAGQGQDETSPQVRRPSCYGDPAQVCPKDDEGVIQPQRACMPCVFLKECLQQALYVAGMIVKPGSETRVVSKATGFLKRWSDKKLQETSPPRPSGSR
jgi:hypothetical protein